MDNSTKRHSFTGSLGFVLAAAGSAVGLGNIWRFPYLAAKDGGGLFLVIYIILALTFGFTLLITEISIGRMTKQSPLTAYGKLRPRWKPLGIVACVVPAIILPYYCAIGGWVIKYLFAFIFGDGGAAAKDGYFNSFISGQAEPVIMMSVFLAITAFVVFRGVNKGIEAMSKVLMPVLLVLVIIIAVFSLTLTHTDEGGTTRTGLEGLGKFIIPDFSDITPQKFLTTLLDAMGQLFFSLSVAMGIMITYGSYVHDDANLKTSINRIEIFDTIVAFLAGVMIIPAVYAFDGENGMSSSGPGLLFMTMPKVFAAMGEIGTFVGILFFAMVLFAALTSAVSIMEAVVSCLMDGLRMSRNRATAAVTGFSFALALLVCFGYNIMSFEVLLPNGTTGNMLDIMDYISNNLLMPVVAILTCILVGWIVKPRTVIDEVEKTGCKMGRKKLYIVMIKFIAPIMLAILFVKSLGLF